MRKIQPPQEEGEGKSASEDAAAPRRRRRDRYSDKTGHDQPETPTSNGERRSFTRYSDKTGHDQPETAPEPETEPTEPRILLVHNTASTYRLIEETLTNFTDAKVDSTPDVLTAFEMAIVRTYQLFVISLTLPDIKGILLYELISRAYATGLKNQKVAPAVVFIREPEEPMPDDEFMRDARIKAVWSKPINIERMLDSIDGVVRRCDPTGG